MPKILNIIPPQRYELIRDRIADILIDEIQGQIDLGADIDSTLIGALYTEKHIPVDLIQLPCIVVTLAEGRYSNKSQRSIDGNYNFYIDVIAGSKSNQNSDGDELASKKVQRVAGIVRTILESPVYNTLGFTKPFLSNLGITEIGFGTPQDRDEPNIQVARLTFSVRVPEDVQFINAVLVYDAVTQVSIKDYPGGYVFAGGGTPTVIPPTCDPVIIKLNNITFSTVPAGSTKNIPVLDQDGNPVGEIDGSTYVVNVAGGSASFESNFEFINIYE